MPDARLRIAEDPIQNLLPFEPLPAPSHTSVVDLFAGIGGLSMGFRDAGFEITGVDADEVSSATFQVNGLGHHLVRDLRTEDVTVDAPVVIGGPPCRPWSSVNLQKRGRIHEDHALLQRFFDHLIARQPRLFVMENVPPLMNDPDYLRLRKEMEFRGYSVGSSVLRYSDFGAATARRRLFTVGIKDFRWGWQHFFRLLERERKRSLDDAGGGQSTVRAAIGWLRECEAGDVPDHVWSQLETIEKYRDRYESGQFGWRKLDWDDTAPSFGSVAKTYILHPDSWENDRPARVVSVREVLSIMGFPRDFRFPADTTLHRRYRMAANAVSPAVSRALARASRAVLYGETAPAEQPPLDHQQ